MHYAWLCYTPCFVPCSLAWAGPGHVAPQRQGPRRSAIPPREGVHAPFHVLPGPADHQGDFPARHCLGACVRRAAACYALSIGRSGTRVMGLLAWHRPYVTVKAGSGGRLANERFAVGIPRLSTGIRLPTRYMYESTGWDRPPAADALSTPCAGARLEAAKGIPHTTCTPSRSGKPGQAHPTCRNMEQAIRSRRS